jgi:Methylamine utilisation protein MauE
MALMLAFIRTLVAVTFVFSASWKLANRSQFRLVLASASGRLRGPWLSALGPAVAVAELAIAVSLVAFPADRAPSVAAAVSLILFSTFLVRAESLANGCGCWRPTRTGRASPLPYLIRNAPLVAVTIYTSVAAPRPVSAGSEAVLLLVAVPLAWLVMEVPAVAEMLSGSGRPVTQSSVSSSS